MCILDLRRGSVETGMSLVGFGFCFYFGIAKCEWREDDVIVQGPGKDTRRSCCFFSVFFKMFNYWHVLDLVSWESLLEKLKEPLHYFSKLCAKRDSSCVLPEPSCRTSPTTACVHVKHSWTLQLWGPEQAIHLKILILKLIYENLSDIYENLSKIFVGATKNIGVEFRGTQNLTLGFQVALVIKNSPANAGSIPGSRRSPGGGHGNPLQYSCSENPMDRGDWWATIRLQRVRNDWNDLACTDKVLY